MVQATDKYLLTNTGFVDFAQWLPLVQQFYPKHRLQKITAALDILSALGIDQPSEHQGSCFNYGVEMAAVLFDLQADEETLAAALLFELYSNQKISPAAIADVSGVNVVKILDGACAMSVVRALQNPEPSHTQANIFRKMLLSIVEDVRIVLVKLADRVCVMRTAKNLTTQYREIVAKEVLEIYAPLANRLGLFMLKWELEDRAFMCLHPVEYKKIAKGLKTRRLEREAYIDLAIKVLTEALTTQHIKFDISGRAKHIYSIWRKLKQKDKTLDSLYDMSALRILVDSIDDCYLVLGSVHDLWPPITSEFDDYIATPKSNGYRSLHTVVHGPDGWLLEVQIRTYQMHNESEMGVAAHWRYKEGVKHDASYEARVNWLRSLLDWETELADRLNAQSMRRITAESRVYAFTPNGDVIDLEAGATVLDFAYMVHTMVGHRTKGAKVNGKMTPLTTQLATGDQVEILTHKEPNPSLDWATSSRGFIHSAKIRARVIRWFQQKNKTQNVTLGKDAVFDALKKYKLKSVNFQQVARHFNAPDEATFFASVATGALRFNQVINYIIEHFGANQATIEKTDGDVTHIPAAAKHRVISNQSGVKIHGIGNLLSRLAGCCKPVQGDEIIGYLTQDRGVTIHRQLCTNFLTLQRNFQQRVIEVAWEGNESAMCQVDLLLFCRDAVKATRDVMSIFNIAKITIVSLLPSVSKKHSLIKLRIALVNMAALENITKKIESSVYIDKVARALN